MKKLIVTSILAISFITANASQLLESSISNDTITKKERKTTTPETYPVVVVEEEADEPFDFNTKDYLPIGFNAYLSLDENFDLEFSAVVDETDEPFEFNTKDYLPVGFNAALNLDAIVEVTIEEEDAPFDFDTKKYLPKGFNPSKKNKATSEL